MKRHKVEFNVLCTANSMDGDHPLEVHRCLRDMVGARYVQFIPTVDQNRAIGEASPWSVRPGAASSPLSADRRW